jgi:hypothetical protein
MSEHQGGEDRCRTTDVRRYAGGGVDPTWPWQG